MASYAEACQWRARPCYGLRTAPICRRSASWWDVGMVLTDERWAALAPLLAACRPKGKTPPRDLRQTIGAIVCRHANGARWRAIPAEHGPWWRAAQLFIRWAKLGVWERLLAAAQEGGVELGMAVPGRDEHQGAP